MNIDEKIIELKEKLNLLKTTCIQSDLTCIGLSKALLNKYYPGDLTKIKSLDLMKEVQKSLGRRLKLDSVGEATLGRNKSGNGIEAVEWWRKGEIDKIIKYCIEDVRLTRELYDFAMTNGHLKFKDFGTIKEIKLDTTNWDVPQSSAMTFTLPF